MMVIENEVFDQGRKYFWIFLELIIAPEIVGISYDNIYIETL